MSNQTGMNPSSFTGIFVCCVCGGRWDYFDRVDSKYYCFKHKSTKRRDSKT